MKKNKFSSDQIDDLQDKLITNNFEYQTDWYNAGIAQRTRNITKARQIGADYYFSREALLDALTTGRNQHFIATSPAEAFDLKANIIHFAESVGVKLTHNRHIYLDNGAMIGFHDEESLYSAHHGNVYLVEYAWMNNPRSTYLAALGVSAHKQYRRTFYTSASKSNTAFSIWNGTISRQKHAEQWRQSLTIYDAVNKGLKFLDEERIQELKQCLSAEAFSQQFLCQWAQEEVAQ